MRLPEYVPSTFDRVSTREELLKVLELLGSFEEPEEIELAQTRGQLARLEADATASPEEILDDMRTSEERLLMKLEPFSSLLSRKAERIN